MRHHKQMRRSALVQTALAVLMSGSLVLFAVMATSIGLRPGSRAGLRPVAPLGSTPGITLPATRAAQAADDVSGNSSSTPTTAAPVGTPSITTAAPANGLAALPLPAPSGDATAPSGTDETPSLGGGTAVAIGDGDGTDGPVSRRGSLNVRRTEGLSPTPTSTDEGGAIVDPDDVITAPSQEPASEDGSEAEPPKQVPNDQNLSEVKKNDSQQKAGPKKSKKDKKAGKGKGKKGSKGAGKKNGGSSSKGINESRSGATSTKSTTARPSKSGSKPAQSKPAPKKSSGSSSEANGGRPHAPEGDEKKKVRRKN